MKQFLKTTLAVILGCLITGGIMSFVLFGIVGALASIGKQQPVMPSSAILRIDLSSVQIAEQTRELDLISGISGRQAEVLGILDAARAIEAASADPAIKYIYLKPDMASGGMAEIEELRQALLNFRQSGKPVISYIENPSNAGYYLASASDKIYMTPHQGGLNTLTGISSQMFFLKDILGKLGINVQLIRHGKYKSAGEMFIRSESSQENLEQNQELIESIWDSWASAIAQGRDISKEDFNAAVDGLSLNFPQDFVDAGLVDGLLTLDQLEDKLTEYFSSSASGEKPDMISISDYARIKVVPNYRADNKVAVIFATGNIVDGTDDQQVAGDRFVRIISGVRKDDNIKAVVFRVNSQERDSPSLGGKACHSLVRRLCRLGRLLDFSRMRLYLHEQQHPHRLHRRIQHDTRLQQDTRQHSPYKCHCGELQRAQRHVLLPPSAHRQGDGIPAGIRGKDIRAVHFHCG